jgi:flagellar motor protein MotB
MKSAVVLFGFLVVSSACVSPEAHRRVVGEKEALQALQVEMRRGLEGAVAEADRLRAEVADLRRRALSTAEIEEQKRALAKLIEQKDAVLGSLGKDVDVIRTPEGIAYRVTGEVLFASGRADLSDSGKRTLLELSKQLDAGRIRVEGHTDDQQISQSQWRSNLHLSAERALAVAEFLTKQAGLPADRVSVAGYGEHRSAVPGSDEAARKKNRRVEILLLGR